MIYLIIVVVGWWLLNFIYGDKKYSTSKSSESIFKVVDIDLNFQKSTSKDGKYLVFDLETTGLNAFKHSIIEIAWILLDKDLKVVEENCFIIKQNSEVPIEAFNIHGIDKAKSIELGVEKEFAFEKFRQASDNSLYYVAHNIDFDSSFIASNISHLKPHKTICTMKKSTSYCRIPKYSGRGYKWPTLTELAGVLFYNTMLVEIPEKHNAANDCKIAAKCFIKLKEIGVIKQ